MIDILEKLIIENCAPTLANLKTGEIVNFKFENIEQAREEVKALDRRLENRGGALQEKEWRSLVMKKMAIVYWSGTGNTKMMAEAVCEGAKEAGADVVLLNVNEANAADMAAYDTVILGCPSMGVEVLEEEEFQPFYDACRGSLNGKNAGLFGSYGWGDGEWMRSWEEDVLNAGAMLPHGYVIINETPDASGLEECREYGKKLAE